MSTRTRKPSVTYRCTECGWTTAKWVGRCGECQSGNQQVCERQFQPGFTHWGSFAEYVALHANSVTVLREDPLKELRIGFDTQARPLEIVLVEVRGAMVLIHAMPLRRNYYPLLEEGR